MEDNNAADNLSVQASVSYSEPAIVQTDSGNQSVHTTVTHGTQGSVHTANTTNTQNNNNASSNPSSPHRGATTTPLSMSPSSAAGRSHNPHEFGGMEPMPQYSSHHPPQQQQHDQHVWVQPNMAPMQQQQHALHQAYPATHRERSNPVSSEEDDHTEPSSSANTGEQQQQNSNDPTSGYTRSDEGATSTFGRLIQSATKVRL